MTQDDLLYRFRLRVFAMAAELGNVRAACRAMGIHPSTYYRWKRQLDRHGPRSCARGNGGCCAATGCPLGPSGTAWSPATPPLRHLHARLRRRSGTWRSTIPGSWSSSTASVSAA